MTADLHAPVDDAATAGEDSQSRAAVERVALPRLPALAVGSVSHARHRPFTTSFRYRQFQWLVDLDDLAAGGGTPILPRGLRWLARFDRRDHLDGGRLGGGIRGDLVRFLARRGVRVDDKDRVVMLAHPRSWGHVFNPLSVLWCLAPDGALKAMVLEVHNTYGGRHAYLLEGSDDTVDKRFYVSPFNDVSGEYEVHVRLTPAQVNVSIGLRREGERVFSAVSRGHLEPATTSSVLAAGTRHAFMTHRVTLLIRLRGIGLWLRRLPIRPRPDNDPEAVR